jgi:hypothetical protein
MINVFIRLALIIGLLSTTTTLLYLLIVNLRYYFFGSSQLLKKLLILEILRILMIFIASYLITVETFHLDLLITVLVFLVVDAVLGLSLTISLRRKTTTNLKINKSFWLCS